MGEGVSGGGSERGTECVGDRTTAISPMQDSNTCWAPMHAMHSGRAAAGDPLKL